MSSRDMVTGYTPRGEPVVAGCAFSLAGESQAPSLLGFDHEYLNLDTTRIPAYNITTRSGRPAR